MKNNHTKEIIVSVVLVLLLVFILNPSLVFMPNSIHMMILVGLVVAFGLFASLILREEATDEREGVHRMLAGRIGFLAGSITILIGILYQSYLHTLDEWLVFTLVVMILAKIGARLYSDRNR